MNTADDLHCGVGISKVLALSLIILAKLKKKNLNPAPAETNDVLGIGHNFNFKRSKIRPGIIYLTLIGGVFCCFTYYVVERGHYGLMHEELCIRHSL